MPVLSTRTRVSGHRNPIPARSTRSIASEARGRHNDARMIDRMVKVPQALWFTYGTPSEVEGYVSDAVDEAHDAGRVPVFVAYNVPGRDCALYSAGGAATGAAYRAWIDGMVNGLGNSPAVIIVEPDGLALLPSDCGQADPYNRVALISYADGRNLANPDARIYIDAGNSNWNTVGLMAERLVDVGVDDVDGFALNVSNFQFTANSNQYGNWISKCIELATNVDPGNYDACPDQYGSLGGVFSRRTGVGATPQTVRPSTRVQRTPVSRRFLPARRPRRTSWSTRHAMLAGRGRARTRIRPMSPIRRLGATRPDAGRASVRRRTRSCPSSTPICGSRRPASRTATPPPTRGLDPEIQASTSVRLVSAVGRRPRSATAGE